MANNEKFLNIDNLYLNYLTNRDILYCHPSSVKSGISALLHHNLYGIKRIVCHPILLAMEGHGETDAVQMGIVLDKGRKAFGLKVLFRLHLNGMYLILSLHQEIQFAT